MQKRCELVERQNQEIGPKDEAYGHLQSGRARAAATNVFWAGLNGFAPALVAALVFTITSRFLTPSEFGIVALASGIASFASAVAPAGFGQALIQRDVIDRSHVDSVFWLCFGSALVIYTALFLAAPLLAETLGEGGVAVLLPVIGLRVIFDLCAVVPTALLARSMSFRKIALRSAVASVFAGCVCLLLLALGQTIWALAISQLAASFALFVGAAMSARWRPRFTLHRRALRQLARFGGFASGHRVLNQISLDQILIGAILGTAALGIYSFARRVFLILNEVISGGLNNVSYTLLSSLQNERDKLADAFLHATFVSAALSFPLFAGLGSVAPDLVPLVFGAQWISAIPVLQLFCVIGTMTSIGILQGTLINSQGKAGWWLLYMGTKQSLTVAVILAIYPYGITQLMLAIVALNIVLWPVAIWKVLQILKMDAVTYLRPLVAPALASLTMLLMVAYADMFLWPGPHITELAVKVFLGALTYCAVMIALARQDMSRMYNLILARRQSRP